MLTIPPARGNVAVYAPMMALAMLLLQGVTLALRLGELRDWVQYDLCIVMAGMCVAGALVWRWRGELYVQNPIVARIWRLLPQAATVCHAYVLLFLGYWLLPEMLAWYRLPAWGLAAFLGWRWQRGGLTRVEALFAAFYALLALALGWRFFSQPLRDTAVVQDHARMLLALAVAYGVGWRALWVREVEFRRWAVCAAMAFGALVMVRIGFSLVGWGAEAGAGFGSIMYHWKPFVEPANAVQQGGWLLWDTPAQYGFLEILMLAWFPAKTVWQAFYLLNGAMIALSGYVIFALLFLPRRTPAGFVFALLVGGSAVGLFSTAWGSAQNFPSCGAYRFVWVYALALYIFVLALKGERLRIRLWHYAAGHVLWLLGAAWSVEGLSSCTLLWVPGCALLALAQECEKGRAGLMRRWGLRAATHLLWLFVLAMWALVMLSAFYWLRLGHPPDWSYYFQFVVAFVKGGFMAMPISFAQSVAGWAGVFAAMVFSYRAAIQRAEFTKGDVLRIAAYQSALMGMWTVSSYFVSRSHENNMINLIPVFVVMSAMVLFLNRSMVGAGIREAYKVVMLGFYGVVAFGGLADMYHRMDVNFWWDAPLVRENICDLINEPPREILTLMDEAGMEKKGASWLAVDVYSSLMAGLYFSRWDMKVWMAPGADNSYALPLPQAMYGEAQMRWADRLAAPVGWLLDTRLHPIFRYPWLEQAILAHYKEVGMWSGPKYRLHKYERLEQPE